MDNEIPPLRSPQDTPPIHTQADLERQWRALMGPLGFGRRSVWMMLLDHDHRVAQPVVQIDEIPRVPGSEDATGMARLLEHVRNDLGASAAFLVTRPGRGGMSAADRAWARMLSEAAQAAGMEPWPVHRANDQELAVCSIDDLAA